MHKPTPAPPPAPPLPFAVQLGNRIKELRKERAWTQRDLALRANLSPQRLSKYESGTHEPPLRALLRISRSLGVLADALLPEAPDLPAEPIDVQLAQRLRWIARLERRDKEGVLGLLDIFFGLLDLAGRRLWDAPPAGPAAPQGGPVRGASKA